MKRRRRRGSMRITEDQEQGAGPLAAGLRPPASGNSPLVSWSYAVSREWRTNGEAGGG